MTVTFFGHKDCSNEIRGKVKKVLTDLIENHYANKFYVGNQGNFDYIVKDELKKLKEIYPHITYAVVIAYMPTDKNIYDEDFSDTIYPDGLENVPYRYAIPKRNQWMIDNSDMVVTHVLYTIGGAAKFKSIAEKKKKTVINIE